MLVGIAMKISRRNNLLSRTAMTPMERRLGRFMRAPDHDAGTGGGDPAGDPPAADPVTPAPDANPAPDTTLLGGDPDPKGDPAPDPDADPEGGDPKSPEEGGDKDEDPAASLLGAPEKYAFDLGEGVTFDQDAFDAIEPVLRDMDLSQDAANKIIGGYAEKVLPVLQQRAETQAAEAGQQLIADWAKETMADKELGGSRLEESKSLAARTISRFLPDNAEGQQFRTFLNESGLGNHPQMMRMLSRIGRELGEAKADPGTGGGRPLTTEEKFYGRKG